MAFALTFDDGPGPSTPDLLAVLKAHDCKATFFMLGENLQDEGLARAASALLKDGHLAANHTMTHNGSLGLSDLRREIEECDRLLQGVYERAGVAMPTPIPFRLPYGIRTFLGERLEQGVRKPAIALDNRLQVLASLGRTHVHWTAILPDWEAPTAHFAEGLAQMAISHIETMAIAGLDAVLAMHDGSPRENGSVASREFTVRAVEIILQAAMEKGWRSFRVPIT
jgi:peptidoglycan-N-acetylglucosamine deacetylase